MAAAPHLYSLKGKKVWVAGHRGMVGSAIVRRLADADCEILTASRDDLDLRRQSDVETWMSDRKPDAVFVAAATVGGIMANATRPAEFLYDNAILEANIIHTAHEVGVEKLMFLGTACIYPRLAPQPIPEDALLTGPLEPTNQWYAIAKIAGIMMCQAYREQHGCDFISAMPNNLYGPDDTYDLEASHVIPALIMKMHAAKEAGDAEVEIWGTGTPKREFVHVDDTADALVFLMERYSDAPHVNIGIGEDISIAGLAAEIAEAVGFTGTFRFDTSKPDGMPRKLLDGSRIVEMGWQAKTPLADGLKDAYTWYLNNAA